LETVMKCGEFKTINLFDATDEQKIVTARYFENKDFFIARLKDEFLDERLFTEKKARELNLFINFLKNKVTVIRIQADNFEVAYQIFEILNNRGLQLSNKDLFRNFIIKEFSDLKSKNTEKYKDLIPNQKWLDLDAYQLDPEFISRYVESKKGSNQKSSAFNNLQNIYNKEFNDGLKEFKIELFFKDIQENLIIYTQIKESNFPNKQIKNRIDYLLASDNTPYIINLLMALLRYTNKEDEILDFLKIFERYILLLNVGSAKRFRSGIIYDVIRAFNQKNFDSAKTIIHLDLTQIAELKEYLARPIIDNDIAKLIIARYYWAIENQSPEDVIEQTLDYDKASLEHIIPQKPAEQTNWMKDFSSEFKKDWTYKLGNMTLLTNKMNQKNSNFDFSKKKEQYAKTKLALTRDLSKIEKISPTHIQNRQTEILEVLYKDLEL